MIRYRLKQGKIKIKSIFVQLSETYKTLEVEDNSNHFPIFFSFQIQNFFSLFNCGFLNLDSNHNFVEAKPLNFNWL